MSTRPVSTRPPRIALRLLGRAFPGSDGEALIGDLLEEHAARVERGDSDARLRWWWWRETITALVVARPAHDPSHDYTGDARMARFVADLRHGVRVLRRAPSFTLVCVLTLALGIGMATAIFSVVRPVLIEPLPYPEPDRLMLVWERDDDGARSNTSFATFSDLSRRATSLAGAAAIGTWMPTISEGGDPERLSGERVSSSYFEVLGVRPAIGRTFRPEEDAPDVNRVALISHGLWRTRFGGDSSLIGRTISLGGVPHEVIGVLPEDFENVTRPGVQVWRPLGYDASLPWACRTCRHLRMLARIDADASPATAREELAAIAAALALEHPRDYPAAGLHLAPLHEDVTRASRPILLVILAAVALVLLLAVASVANLQLTRALRRSREFAVRAALGAGRARLVQQLLAEGLVLATAGGTAGVIVAWIALPLLLARLPQGLPRLDAVRLDLAALLAAGLLTLALGIAIGLVPALAGGRASVFGGLRSGTRDIGGPRRLASAALVAGQLALALVLLAGAGLLARTLANLLATDPGFDARGVLVLDVQATGPAYATNDAVYANHDRLRELITNIPGVMSVGLINQLPLGGNMDSYGIRAQDRPLANPALAPSGDRYVVSPGLTDALRISMVRGRNFTGADFDSAAPPVALLSASLARRIWGTDDAIGKRVQMGAPDSPWREVVGITRDVRHSSLDAEVNQQIWLPERQWTGADVAVTIVVRTQGDPGALASSVRAAVRSVDPGMPITQLATMEQIVAASTAQRRLALVLFVAFGGTALLIAAAGVYGVLAGSVVERTREIGVRTALGATPGRIVALMLGQGSRLIAAGLVLGLAGTLALGRVLRSLLYQVASDDPATLAGVVVVLLGVALVASAVPIRRALRIDPATALRAE